MFITFEGGEGVGKSTQVKRLVDRLEQFQIPFILTREPGGSPLAERIRTLLLDGVFKQCGPEVEAVMFAAARSDHLKRTILPALNDGKVVICDRFFDSTWVYQTLTGANEDFLKTLREEATNGVDPHLTIILDLDEKTAAERIVKRRAGAAVDRFEQENAEFHSNVRSRFRMLAEQEPTRCVLIDASGTADEVDDRIWDVVKLNFPSYSFV